MISGVVLDLDFLSIMQVEIKYSTIHYPMETNME